MELQYEIEAREEVERCFVHIDYETREYDEHVVSKVRKYELYRCFRVWHGTHYVAAVSLVPSTRPPRCPLFGIRFLNCENIL